MNLVVSTNSIQQLIKEILQRIVHMGQPKKAMPIILWCNSAKAKQGPSLQHFPGQDKLIRESSKQASKQEWDQRKSPN